MRYSPRQLAHELRSRTEHHGLLGFESTDAPQRHKAGALVLESIAELAARVEPERMKKAQLDALIASIGHEIQSAHFARQIDMHNGCSQLGAHGSRLRSEIDERVRLYARLEFLRTLLDVRALFA